MKLSKKEIETLKEIQYLSFLDRCFKKNKIQILSNPYGFVRGISRELADDMLVLTLEKVKEVTDIQTLKRLKFICEYFINKKSKRRRSYDSPNSKTKIIIDKFTVYESQLEQINLKLKPE